METRSQQQTNELKKQLQTLENQVKMLEQQNKMLKTHLTHAHEMATNKLETNRLHRHNQQQELQQLILREKKLKIKVRRLTKKNDKLNSQLNSIKDLVNRNESSDEEDIDLHNTESGETSE